MYLNLKRTCQYEMNTAGVFILKLGNIIMKNLILIFFLLGIASSCIRSHKESYPIIIGDWGIDSTFLTFCINDSLASFVDDIEFYPYSIEKDSIICYRNSNLHNPTLSRVAYRIKNVNNEHLILEDNGQIAWKLYRILPKDSSINLEKICFASSLGHMRFPSVNVEINKNGICYAKLLRTDNNGLFKTQINQIEFLKLQEKIRAFQIDSLKPVYNLEPAPPGIQTYELILYYNNGKRKHAKFYSIIELPSEVMNIIKHLNSSFLLMRNFERIQDFEFEIKK